MKKLSILALFLSFSIPALAGTIKVTNVSGAPTINRGSETLPVTMDTAIQSGDKIETAENCTLDLSMNNVAGCRILPGSHAEISQPVEGASRVQLAKGNAIFNLKKLPDGARFEVETPTAVAAVRGTQFWGRVDATQTTNPVTTFAVREGVVEITAKAAGKTFSLVKGQALDIPKDGSAPAMRDALAEEMQAMSAADQIPTGY